MVKSDKKVLILIHPPSQYSNKHKTYSERGSEAVKRRDKMVKKVTRDSEKSVKIEL
jgi:hypothetical protein